MFAAIGTVVAQQRKQPVKKTTVSAEEHLCFEGVPINGNKASFDNKLKTKGIRVLKDDDWDNFCLYKKRKARIRTNYEKSNINTMCDCSVEYFFEDNIPNNFLETVCKEIEDTYNCKKNITHLWYEFYDYGSIIYYSIYSKKNRNKQIGVVTISEGLWCGQYTQHTVTLHFYDHINNIKNNKDEYLDFFTNDIKWYDYPYSLNNFISLKYGLEDVNDNVHMQLLTRDNIKYKYILTNQDKMLFYNLIEKCDNNNLRDYIFNRFLDETKKIACNYKNECHIFDYTLSAVVESYNREIENKERERQKQRQRQQQLAQRRKSFGFMDLMHLLAPGFFTQDDVELWNKMSESDQKAIIQGSFGAYFGMGDTRGHTERMHTPSLRNQ